MTAPAPGLPQDVERARVAAWEAAHDSLRDDVLHNADGFDNDIVNHFLGMIDDADQRPYDHIAAHVAPPVSASFEEALTGLDVEALDRLDNGAVVWGILGLDDVRAAHRAEVDAAVAAKEEAEGANILNRNAVARLSARVAKLEAALECYEILDSYGLTPTDPRWASVGEDGAMSMLRARGVNAGSLGDSYAIVRAKARAALEDPK